MKNINEMKLELQDIKTLGNYSEKEKEKYEFDKTRDFYNRILDMFHDILPSLKEGVFLQDV